MSLSDDEKIEVLKTLIQEDRTEARVIRARIENVVWSVVVASFAITAFWLKPPLQSGHSVRWVALLSDVSLLVVILVVFSRSMLDLRHHRKAQEARQDLLLQIANTSDATITFDPFPDARDRTVRLKDHDMIWMVSAATVLMVVKAIVSFRFLA